MEDALVGELRFEIRRIAFGNDARVVQMDISPPLTMERRLDPLRPGHHLFTRKEGGGREWMAVLGVGEGRLVLGKTPRVDDQDAEAGILVRPAQHAMSYPDRVT